MMKGVCCDCGKGETAEQQDCFHGGRRRRESKDHRNGYALFAHRREEGLRRESFEDADVAYP